MNISTVEPAAVPSISSPSRESVIRVSQTHYFPETKMKTALLIDCHNLYVNCLKTHPGKIPNYELLLDHVTSAGNVPMMKFAYSKQTIEKAGPFAELLVALGFDLVFGPENHKVQMTIRAMQFLPRVDHLILGTNDPEFASLACYAQHHGVLATVMGFGFTYEAYHRDTSVVELGAELLQDRAALPA